jgi:hypothetical protein
VPNVERLGVPVKLGLEFGAVIRLKHVDAKRQPTYDFVQEADRCSLVARVEHLQDADAVPQIVTTHLWREIHPPPSLRLHQKDEDPSEIDIIIETEVSVWFIEAKFKSDISTKTTNNPTRDQVVRNLDVGSWYAGVRDFYFSLLVTDDARSPKGMSVLKQVWPKVPTLPHRPDGMNNIKGCGRLLWRDIASVLRVAGEEAPRDDERVYARRALGWMGERGLS